MVSNFLVCATLQIKLHLLDRLWQVSSWEDGGGEAWLREPVSEEMFGRLPTATFQHPEGPVPCFFSNCSKANDLTSYQSRALYFSSPA